MKIRNKFWANVSLILLMLVVTASLIFAVLQETILAITFFILIAVVSFCVADKLYSKIRDFEDDV